MGAQDLERERERLERLVRNGPEPEGVISEAPAGAPAAEGVFSVADLIAAPDVTAEAFAMRDGKVVWVHSLPVERVCWLQAQAARWVEAEGKRPGATDQDRQARAYYAGYIMQVIACCRQGPEPTAPPVFGIEHAEVVWRNLGWERIRKICELSDRLGGDEDRLQDTLAAFFTAAQTWAEIWSGRLTADTLPDGRQALEAFAGCVSRIRRRGALSAEDLATMREMAGE